MLEKLMKLAQPKPPVGGESTASIGYPPLTEHQKQRLEMLAKGYAISASRRGWKAQEYREMEDLVARGLARKTNPVAWNKAGAFVKVDN